MQTSRLGTFVWPRLVRPVQRVAHSPATFLIVLGLGLSGWLGCDGVVGPEVDPVTTWSVSLAPTWPLNDVWGASSSDVFAVGNEGTILHYDGTQWSSMTSGTAEDLYGVWGSSSSDVFAVGDSRTILHYDGTQWSHMTSGTSAGLWGIWGTSSSDVYAVGTGGAILHYDGTEWNPMTSGTDLRLFSVWGTPSGDVFAAGDLGVILRGEH